MKVFVIGATGFVGGAIAQHLVDTGHEVIGLARTAESAEGLIRRGIAAVLGDLDVRRSATVAAALQADAVIYAAQVEPELELVAIDALTKAMTRSGKALLFLSGSGVLMQRTAGEWSQDTFAEDDMFTVEPLASSRKAAEELVLEAASDTLRAIVVRPGVIWGPGDHGHVPLTYRSVAVTGAACYVGAGLSVYSHVHVDDVSRLFALALASGRPGGLYHAVSGEVPNRWIAERVASDLGVETRSVTPEQATEVWGEFGALMMSATSRLRGYAAHRDLGWRAEHDDMLSEVGEKRLRALAQRT